MRGVPATYSGQRRNLKRVNTGMICALSRLRGSFRAGLGSVVYRERLA